MTAPTVAGPYRPTIENVQAATRWIALAVLLLCAAVLLDFNDLRRLDRRHSMWLSTLDARQSRLARAVEDLKAPATRHPGEPDTAQRPMPRPRPRPAADGKES